MYNGYLVVDGHADILYRMQSENESFYNPASKLHQSYDHLAKSGIDLQVFVTFIFPDVTASEQLYRVLDSLHRFRDEIEMGGKVVAVHSVAELERYVGSERKVALLSLEGADALNGHISVLDTLYRLGVRLMGLTWNGSNMLADGVGEERGAGLTAFGKDVVHAMQSTGMLVDVSHLSRRGVFDVAALSRAPIVASHSNAATVYAHRRNLDDEQIRAIAATGGVVGATFVPEFVGAGEALAIPDLLRHVEHLLEVGGEDAVAVGSDFDGIERTLVDLRTGADYPRLLQALEQAFGEKVARKMAGENWLRVLRSVLPQ